MKFSRRGLFGLSLGAAVAPIAAKLPPGDVYGRMVGADVLPDMAALQARYMDGIVNPPLMLEITHTGVRYRGIPVRVVDKLGDET